MSKGNIFLGFGRGKVGDVVFSRQNGEQITRARNRSPKNPQSPLQLLQRVLMKTNSLGYSMLRPLSDHAFQGVNQGTPSQSRFSVLNIAAMRSQLAEIINSGDAEQILTSNETNFALRDAVLPPVYPFIVSEGTIPTVRVGFRSVSDVAAAAVYFSGDIISAAQNAVTYQQLVNALGLQRGDQLTFVMMAVDDSATAIDAGYFNGIQYARVILEPSSGDMSAPFFSVLESGGAVVNLPNAKNEGSVVFAPVEGNTLSNLPVFSVNGVTMDKNRNSVCGAFTCIASRESGGVWQRSLQKLTVRLTGSALFELEYDTQVYFLGDAIRSYLTSQSSLLYLNQAEG